MFVCCLSFVCVCFCLFFRVFVVLFCYSCNSLLIYSQNVLRILLYILLCNLDIIWNNRCKICLMFLPLLLFGNSVYMWKKSSSLIKHNYVDRFLRINTYHSHLHGYKWQHGRPTEVPAGPPSTMDLRHRCQ